MFACYRFLQRLLRTEMESPVSAVAERNIPPPEVEEDEFANVPKSVRALWKLPMYSEARTWFQWSNIFMPSDIADFMGIDTSVAKRLIDAAVWHRIVKNTEETDGRETIFEYIPLPPGPRLHKTGTPPERITPGVYDLAPANRGMPVRIRTERDQRKSMSTPGARGVINRREQRYKAMLEAVEVRKKKQAERLAADPNWRKTKKKSIKV